MPRPSISEQYGLITRGDLRRYLDTGQLQLHYQPIIDLVGGAISSVQAMLRWQDSRSGWIQPDDFLSLVEESELTIHLDCWVLETAGQQMVRWQNLGLHWNLTVSTSLKSLQRPPYRTALLRMVEERLLHPRQLTLLLKVDEVQECSYELWQLHWLSVRGVELSLEDIDVARIQPAWLMPLPIREIRLARLGNGCSSAHRPPEDPLASLLSVATTRRFRVVGTNVDTPIAFQRLQALGIDRGQGSHICPPMEADLLVEHLRRTGALSATA